MIPRGGDKRKDKKGGRGGKDRREGKEMGHSIISDQKGK